MRCIRRFSILLFELSGHFPHHTWWKLIWPEKNLWLSAVAKVSRRQRWGSNQASLPSRCWIFQVVKSAHQLLFFETPFVGWITFVYQWIPRYGCISHIHLQSSAYTCMYICMYIIIIYIYTLEYWYFEILIPWSHGSGTSILTSWHMTSIHPWPIEDHDILSVKRLWTVRPKAQDWLVAWRRDWLAAFRFEAKIWYAPGKKCFFSKNYWKNLPNLDVLLQRARSWRFPRGCAKIDHEMLVYSQLFELHLSSLRRRSHSPWWRTLTRRLHFGQDERRVLGTLTQII